MKHKKKLVEFAVKNKINIAYNPSSYLCKKGETYIENILQETDLLVLNKEEATYLVGKKNQEETLKKILKLGPKLAVVTDGKNKMYATDGIESYSLEPIKTEVVETTGAGDAFASAFLAGIMKKGDIEFALKLGIVNSGSVISDYGTQGKLLTYKEALEKIENIKIKVKKL